MQGLGLTLLIVPDPTPFLTISKTYWTARARSSEQHLQDEVAAHRALIDAAASPDPPAEVLRRLARAVDGWAASSPPPANSIRFIQPDWSRRRKHSSQRSSVWRSLASTRPRRSSRAVGTWRSSLVGRGDRGGLLGRRHDGALSAMHRRVVLTAGALLSIDSIHWQRTAPARGDGPLRGEPGGPWAH